jgi:hypothetical protein
MDTNEKIFVGNELDSTGSLKGQVTPVSEDGNIMSDSIRGRKFLL